MLPLEVKPLLVGQGSAILASHSSYWLATKTTIKGDEYFIGYTGTIGRRVWAIVKALSGWNARQTSLSPFDLWLLVVVKCTRDRGSIISLFSNTSSPLLASSLSVFFVLLE